MRRVFLILIFITLYNKSICINESNTIIYEECLKTVSPIFKHYYKISFTKNINIQSNLHMHNKTIFYQTKGNTFKSTYPYNFKVVVNKNIPTAINNISINYKYGQAIYLQNGKLYMQMIKSNIPKLIFSLQNDSVKQFSIDHENNIVFSITNNGNLYAIKLKNLMKHKNKCTSLKIEINNITNINKISVDSITGDLFISNIKNNFTNLYILEKLEDNPCDEFVDISMLKKNITNSLKFGESHLLRECRKLFPSSIYKSSFEKAEIEIRKIINDTVQSLTSLLKIHTKEQKKNNNNIMKDYDECKTEVERNTENRIKIGTMISILLDEYIKIPKNMTQYFLSTIQPQDILSDEMNNYECILKSELNEYHKTSTISDYSNTEIQDNLEAILSETLTDEEIEAINTIDDIFGGL